MKTDRILTGEVQKFFTTKSPMRDRIVDYVRENLDEGKKSVALCFRGDFSTLYYRSHQLLRIRNSASGLIGEFDFRHARFTKNYREILDRLSEMGVDISNFSDADTEKGKSTSRRYVRFPLIGFGEEKLKEVLGIYKGLIDDFLDPNKTEYAFDRKEWHLKSHNIEKDRQQQLYAAYFLHEDLVYYDIEYTEPHANEKDVSGRVDLLGLKAEEDGSYTLILAELKSTKHALKGESGVEDHEENYKKYLDNPGAEERLKARKEEACATVALLCELFEKPYPKNLTPENIKHEQIKFVFSDAAVEDGKKFVPKDPRTVKVYLCEKDGTERK